MPAHPRDDAVRRLNSALLDQERLDGRFRAVVGTLSAFGAYARLRGGRRDVAARQAWLNRVDEDVATAARAKKVVAATSDAHDAAVVRLETALVEQTRSGGRYRSALGTTNELLDDGDRVVVNGREVGGAGSIFTGA